MIMKSFTFRSCLALLFVLLSVSLFAQEKTQAYYNTHENEILPDAQAAFRVGNYERAIQLCTWHYVFFGNREAEPLQKQAEKCDKLSKNLESLYAEGKKAEALEVAMNLLAINPNDPSANRINEELSKPETPPSIEEAIPPKDTVATPEFIPHEEIVPETPLEQVPYSEPVPVKQSNPKQNQSYNQNVIVLKAGMSLIDFKLVSPNVSFGLYEIAGTRVGAEIGAFLCPGLSADSASLLGIDLNATYKIGREVYPKAGIGLFSCASKDGNGARTNGLCAELRLTYIIGQHFCVEVGAKLFPKVELPVSETVSTAGASYRFPSSRQIVSGGVAPVISVGWTF